MSNYPTIRIFTKPGCPYCTKAKAVLTEAGLPYTQYDVKETQRNADLSIYASGVATVPQIFIGDYHVNGAEDLEQLQQNGRLSQLVEALGDSTLSVQNISDETARQGAEDWTLRHVVSATDGSRSDDPEAWALLRFYKDFFGFWPNTFAYLNHWPEAYKLFVYCHNFSAVGYGKKVLGPLNMFTVGYSTSDAHGCNYCQVHSAATGGEQSLKAVKQFKEARAGNRSEGNPYGDLELAIAQLAAEATRNAVSDETLSKIRQLAETPQQAQEFITGVEMMVAAFGFLNVFNDLTGLELEGQWAKQASEQAGVEAGRHSATQDENPSNLDYELPSGGPSIEEMLAKYGQKIEDLEAYCESEFGLLPNWVQRWPQPLQRLHVYLYGELMGERSHTLVSAELKHLMGRVSAIAKDHDYLAAVEGFMAYHTALLQ
ncbi:glutaredoxin domain-containing protein [cf. Phormidesmis sp. LEGE 11477]|uniref:glutaredoxin domain-containing protein n=1 Tax=cf. Phormidesmis sp. LEGE 11477 TaxID=1828680 RepID=UPI001881517E|nr:glutaredoxin domain-containing protein [cf. Phormidesmis sp. LEGE 11477]MBE9063886.1 glutathione S-transferase N-terminal domain-containing protein [cf. Phormidesmis sp. LEGE 11477]